MGKIIFAVVAALMLTGCTGGNDDGSRTKSRYETDLSAGKEAVDFLYKDMEARPFRLSEQKGKVVLLYFWRMKCEVCKEELRAIDSLRKRYAAKGLVVVAVGADSMHSGSLYDVFKFLEKEGFGFVMLRDEDGFVAEAYRVMMAPEAYIIGRDGRIALVQKGPVDWNGQEMTGVIEKLLMGGVK